MKKGVYLFLLSVLVMIGGCQPGGDPVDEPGGDPNPSGGGTAPTASMTIKKSMRKVTAEATGVLNDAQAEVRWDWTNDGTWDTEWSAVKTAGTTYEADGTYTIKLEVRNAAGRTDSCVKTFTITYLNRSPKAVFAYNLIQGMTVSADASNSSDTDDAPEDLQVRWDWDGDGTYDTEWTTTKTAEHTYEVSGSYTVQLQVKDLNGACGLKNEKIVASPTTIRSCFFTGNIPYMLRINFRIINNLTGLPVGVNDDPPLKRDYFAISEDNVPIDLSETGYLLTNVSRPMELVLILDYTGSMHDAGGIAGMVRAAKAFINSQDPTTSVSLWAFWERQDGYMEIDDFTPCTEAGKSELINDLDAFTAQARDQGATEIWDLIKKVIKEKFVPADIGTNRAVVFLSDGHDTTSKTTVSQLIKMAQNNAISFFAMGVAFRPEEFPTDEPNLVSLAEKTGGTYFTVNQVSDLAGAFDQMARDLRCDWTLSYITLKSSGSHTFSVDCDYMDGLAAINGLPFNPEKFQGNIRRGLLSVKKGTVTDTQTEYVLSADYIPRNICSLKVRVGSKVPVRLGLYENNALCTQAGGWAISPDVEAGEAVPADGWYTISSIDNTPLEFGGFGKIAKCTADAGNLPDVVFEVPPMETQSEMYGDKSIAFFKTDGITLQVPTVMTGLNVNEPVGSKQTITVAGRGFSGGDRLVMMVKDLYGDKILVLKEPVGVAADGSSMTIEIPSKVQPYDVWVLDGYERHRFPLNLGAQ